MTGYVCKRCPLAFEIGYYGYWDLSGGCVQYVCRGCGTMHKIDHLQGEADRLFAVEGPIRAMAEETLESPDGQNYTSFWCPFTEDSWQLIGVLPTSPSLLYDFILPVRAEAVDSSHLACARCDCIGQLVSNEWPLDTEGKWPSFGESCPVCRGHLQWVYVNTIN